MSTIREAGQLREFLLTAMMEAKSGDLDLERAKHVASLAGRVNDSLMAEVRIMECERAAGNPVTTPLGKTNIGRVPSPDEINVAKPAWGK